MFTTKLHQIILCANAKQLVAGLWHADQLQHSERFLNTNEGHEAFQQYLAAYPNTKIKLITNAVEEDYRVENLPHTAGRAKNELITRKLDQFYRGLNYRTAHFIMREKDKRKDDRYLFVALNNDDFLQNWMQIIQTAEAQLEGVYVLPMLSRFLVKQFKVTAPHILLCEMLSTGLRQTYLHNGRLRMSRLIPNVPTDSKQLSYFYSVETQKTRLYLMSKRLITRDTVLNVQLASLKADAHNAIQESFQHEPGFECEVMQLNHFIKAQQLSQPAISKIPELLHMQLLASGHQVDNFAPEALTKHYQLSRWATSIKTMSLLLGMGATLISLWFFYQGYQHQQHFASAQQATQLEQLKYNTVAADFPKAKLSALGLKKAVILDQQLAHYPKSPRKLLTVLSEALEASPEIKLNGISWQQNNFAHLAATEQVKPTLRQNLPSTSVQDSSLLENAKITAEITTFDGNFRHANQLVNQFVQQLKKNSQVAYVAVTEAPTNQDSYTDLSGSTNDALTTDAKAADFTITLVLLPTLETNAGEAP